MSNNNMCYEYPQDHLNNSGVAPQAIPPKKENVRKADVIVTFLSKEQDKDTKEVYARVRGIKTTIYGYIEYNSYNTQYTVKDVLKRVEGIMCPFEKSFDIGFINLPLDDERFILIPKSSIVNCDVQVSDFDEEVDSSKTKSSQGFNDNYRR